MLFNEVADIAQFDLVNSRTCPVFKYFQGLEFRIKNQVLSRTFKDAWEPWSDRVVVVDVCVAEVLVVFANISRHKRICTAVSLTLCVSVCLCVCLCVCRARSVN